MALSLALTCLVAFSSGPLIPAAALIGCLLASLSLKLPHSWIKPVLVVALWTWLISVPLIFIEPKLAVKVWMLELWLSVEGAYEALSLTLRAAAATAIFIASVQLLGWRNWLKGLEGLRVPQPLVRLMQMSIIYIPLFLREASKMLWARESRIVSRMGIKRAWGVLSTVVGDLLLRGYERAWRLEKALKARSFHPL